MMNSVERKQIQDVYVRLCRDSKFTMDYIQVAILTASMLKIQPLEVWGALDFNQMEQLADGTHPYYKTHA